MESLLAQIASKRKAIDEDIDGRGKKYMRRGEIERLKEEKEKKEREEKLAKEQSAKAGAAGKDKEKVVVNELKAGPSRSASFSPAPSAEDTPEPEAVKELSFNISNEETIRRLRAKGQPIRLFGESDKDRRLRLRALELIEEKGHDREAGHNDFRKALEDVESIERELKMKGKGKKNVKEAAPAPITVLDLSLLKTNPDKVYPLIYHAIKRVLKEWAEAMDERPEHIKMTNQGKLAAATQVQTGQYLKPLFKQLRSRSLPEDVLGRIAEIVHYMQKRQYQKANDSYLRLSIGNAPWPIGVTMVGIHERSAREKISTDQVAHVLNDEVSRKYIQSLKRLLTFSQTKYPPDDISQLMG